MENKKFLTLTGQIDSIEIRKDHKGNPWIVLNLKRQKDKIHCTAFTNKAQHILNNFKVGDSIKINGFFEQRSYYNKKRQKVSIQNFTITQLAEAYTKQTVS